MVGISTGNTPEISTSNSPKSHDFQGKSRFSQVRRGPESQFGGPSGAQVTLGRQFGGPSGVQEALGGQLGGQNRVEVTLGGQFEGQVGVQVALGGQVGGPSGAQKAFWVSGVRTLT